MTKVTSKVDEEIERFGSFISAAEDWSKQYNKAPEHHAKLIKTEQKLETALRNYFREFAKERLPKLINWHAYLTTDVKAYQYGVIVDDVDLDDELDYLINVMHDPIALAIVTGANAGELIYNYDVGISSASKAIQDAARKHTANLVKDINSTTKGRIQSSISTSLRLGEDQAAATTRLIDIINDAKRAGTIARTEAVNGYQQGLNVFATESGAVAHEWQDVGATDQCASNTSDGPIPIDTDFSSGDHEPPAHPNCRCGRRLIYQNEVDSGEVEL